MFDRITYAFIGAIFGALIGVGCWWLYGLAHSLNYDGPGIDPVLRHWVTYAGGAFGVIGFLLRQRLAGRGNTQQPSPRPSGVMRYQRSTSTT